MSAASILHQSLLVLAVAALGGAGLRLASLLAPAGLERVLAAIVFAVSGAVAEAMILGLAGLGGGTAPLTLAAAATFALAAAVLPRPAVAPAAELVAWLRGPAAAPRLAVGAAAGIVVGYVAWQLRHPLIGIDALTYHLPIASAWVQNGRPGSVVEVLRGFPLGNYPLTNEVIVAWALAISRSWAIVSIWSPLLLVAFGLGGWVTLRELNVAVPERVLAILAMSVPPVMIGQLGATYTDVATLAWLAVAAALALAARRHLGLVYPAMLAAALCLGTKTTPSILLLALALTAARPLRAARARWLLPTLGVAVVVGGIWSVRNLIEHGSPLWPFVSAPWGDPVPVAFRPWLPRFIGDARYLVGTYWRDYLSFLGGIPVLIAGGLVLPLVRRSREALAAAGVAAVALLAWSLAPATGIAPGQFGAISGTRYMQPAVAACAVALVLCARDRGALRLAVLATLAASIVYSLVESVTTLGHLLPSPGTFAVAAGAGLLAAALLRRPPVALERRLLGVALSLACAVGLAAGGHRYVERYLAFDKPVLQPLFTVPALSRGTAPIAFSRGVVVFLRGDRLEHPLALIGDGESCAAVRARLRGGPLVLLPDRASPIDRRLAACLRGVAPDFVDQYADVYRAASGQ